MINILMTEAFKKSLKKAKIKYICIWIAGYILNILFIFFIPSVFIPILEGLCFGIGFTLLILELYNSSTEKLMYDAFKEEKFNSFK